MPITREDVEVILHSQKSLLYDYRVPWVKKESGSFDVNMGAYDVVDVCKFINIYMSYLLGKKYNSKTNWLYSDDGIVVFKTISEPASEKIEKQLQSMFEQKGLRIFVDCNLKVVNYLNVTFKLSNGSYRPYRKPNDETHYIHI